MTNVARHSGAEHCVWRSPGERRPAGRGDRRRSRPRVHAADGSWARFHAQARVGRRRRADRRTRRATRDCSDRRTPSGGGIVTVRVVLADDHPMYRYGLGAILEQAESVEVVASVGNGDELVRAAAEHHPDVVVTDLSMPDLDGVAATKLLLRAQPELAVLVLTMHEDDEHVFAALRAGARGYLVKGAGGEEIVRAVVAVASGDAVYGGAVARRIVAFFAGGRRVTQCPGVPRPHPTRARDPGTAGNRLPQPRDRPTTDHVGEDGAQPCLPGVAEASRARPHRRCPEGQGGRSRHSSCSLTQAALGVARAWWCARRTPWGRCPSPRAGW